MNLFSFVIGLFVVLYVACTNPVKGLGRWLAPDTMAVLMLFMIFGIRPLFTERFQLRTIYGLTPSAAGIQAAMTAGAIGMVAFCAGVFIASARPRKLSAFANHVASEPRRRFSLTAGGVVRISVLSILVYVAVLAVLAGPGAVASLALGRSAAENFANVPEVVLIIPLSGSIIAAIFLLSNRDARLTKVQGLLTLMGIAISVVFVSQLGDRRFLIPSLLIPLVAHLMRRPLRMRISYLVVAFVTFIFLAIVPVVRSAGARLPGENLLTASWRVFSDTGLIGVITPVFASYDTEMLDYIGIGSDLLRNGSAPGYGFGRGTIFEFLTRPFPQSFGLPTGYSDQMLTALYGGGCGDPVCPVPSVVGVLYFDGSFALVALGCFLFGMFLRWLSTLWAMNSSLTLLKATFVAVASSFALIATRTDTTYATWWAIYAILLAVMLYYLCTRKIRLNKDLQEFVGRPNLFARTDTMKHQV